MKKLIAAFLLLAACRMAAQAPQQISYQAVARDNSGVLLANQSISVRITLTSGLGGNLLYQEVHAVTTNAFGLFSLAIGAGTPGAGNFAAIDWATANAWMNIDMDANGGSSYVAIGSSRFLSVPYALHAGSSADNKWNLTNTIDITNTNAGNVGIGTSVAGAKLSALQTTTFSPAGKFELNNALSASDAVVISGNGSGNSLSSNAYGTGHAGYFAATNPSGANHAIFALAYGSGNALGGVHTGSGYSVYGYQNGAGGAGFFQTYNALNAANALTSLTNGSGAAAYFASTGTGPALMTGSGNVGIGVSMPSAKLHVAGNIKMVDGNQAQGKVLTSDANGTGTWSEAPGAAMKNSAFQVGSYGSQQIPSGSETKVNWMEILDDGGAFSADAFTAPANGIYHFEANLQGSVSNTASPNYYQDITLKKNGVAIATAIGHGVQNAQTQFTYQLNTTVLLNAGDVITVWVRQYSTFSMTLFPAVEYCWFSGFRLY
jgi:hypothetical protein